jgi:hypothetical protein
VFLNVACAHDIVLTAFVVAVAAGWGFDKGWQVVVGHGAGVCKKVMSCERKAMMLLTFFAFSGLGLRA